MTLEERAKQAVDAMARHWSDYSYDEIVAQFRDAIKTAIENEREACAKIADYYVTKSDEFKQKVEQERQKSSSARLLKAEDEPTIDGKIAVARTASQTIAKAIRGAARIAAAHRAALGSSVNLGLKSWCRVRLSLFDLQAGKVFKYAVVICNGYFIA
jgi:hypothetical protein